MKKLLVPTDFSEHAYYALKAAATIAKKFGCEIHLLHIMDMPQYSGGITNIGMESFLAMREKMEGVGLVKALDKEWDRFTGQPFLKDVKTKTHVKFGDIYEEIQDFADAHEVDMIVMGSHGARGLKEFFGGSNTERVVRLVQQPVLAIKQDADKFEIKNIVFASNFFGEVGQVFETIKEFAEGFDATLHLLKVVTPDDFERSSRSRKMMHDFVEKFDLKKYTVNIYNEASIEDGINSFSEEVKPDIVSLTTHGFTGVARLLSGGSIAEDMVNRAKTPVLTIKIRKPDLKRGAIFPD